MAEGLGHSLVPTTPALVPLALAGSFHVPLPPERVVAVLRQACRSLGEAHAAGLLHRDIKPHSLFLCRMCPMSTW